MSGTGTRTASDVQTFVEQVLRVTRPLFTDLLAIADTYGHLSNDEAWKYVCDFRSFMNERYLDHVEIAWTNKATGVVVDGLMYVVRNGEAVRTMDRPGGIRHDITVAAAAFNLHVGYTDLWHGRTPKYKAAFKADLKIRWSRAEALDYAGGSYVDQDRVYGAASVGVSRLRFKAS